MNFNTIVTTTENITLNDKKNKKALDHTKLCKSLLLITKWATMAKGKQIENIESANVAKYNK